MCCIFHARDAAVTGVRCALFVCRHESRRFTLFLPAEQCLVTAPHASGLIIIQLRSSALRARAPPENAHGLARSKNSLTNDAGFSVGFPLLAVFGLADTPLAAAGERLLRPFRRLARLVPSPHNVRVLVLGEGTKANATLDE